MQSIIDRFYFSVLFFLDLIVPRMITEKVALIIDEENTGSLQFSYSQKPYQVL